MTKKTRGTHPQVTPNIAGRKPSEIKASAPTPRENLLKENEVAEWLGISPLTLRKWRCLRTQPLPFLKIKKIIRYKESDLLRFQESKMVRFGEVR